jgi:hypothetical protein
MTKKNFFHFETLAEKGYSSHCWVPFSEIVRQKKVIPALIKVINCKCFVWGIYGFHCLLFKLGHVAK